MKAYGLWLACALAVLLASAAIAQDDTPGIGDDQRNALLFRIGMESLEQAAQTADEAERHKLHDKAIAAFRMILVNRPDLVRVRLELARVFFLRGRDGLARRHFELVLAGGVPPPVAVNIHTFLNIMRARKRWTGYFGAAIAPDSNLNAASESEIIYIDTVFGRSALHSERGISAPNRASACRCGAAANIQHRDPLERAAQAAGRGSDVARAGVSRQRLRPVNSWPLTLGPRWLAGPIEPSSACSATANSSVARRGAVRGRDSACAWRWAGSCCRACGRTAPRRTASATTSTRDFLDGPVADFTAELRLGGGAGASRAGDVGLRARADAANGTLAQQHAAGFGLGTSLALPLGFTLGVSGQMRWTYYYKSSGQVHLTLARQEAAGPYPRVHRLGAQPSFYPVRLQPAAGAHSTRSA